MILKNSKYLVMLALTLTGFKQAHAACGTLSISAQSALIDLNTQNLTAVIIGVSRTGTGSCNFFVTANNGPAATFSTRYIDKGTDQIPFQIYKDAGKVNILKSFAESTTNNDVLFGSFSGNNLGPINVSYFPYVDTGFSAPNGPYVESYKFFLYEGTIAAKASAVQRDSKATNMKYEKGGYVELSLVDTGSIYNAADTSQTLNFGNLATGAVRSFDVMLKYNGGYKLSMSSINSSNISNGTRLIPYTVTLNNSPISVTSGLPVRTHTDDGGGTVSPSTGLRLPMAVTIGTVGTSPNGTYTDTVSITVASP